MKSLTAMLIMLSMTILVAGCASETDTGGGYYKYTGPQMIEAHFAKDAPVSMETAPYEANEDIDVTVELINRLTEDIPANNVKVRLTGDAAMPNFFSGAREVSNPLLRGINLETGATNPEEVDLGPINYIGEVVGKISKTITGQYCYSHPIKVKGNLFYTAKAEEIGENLPSGSNPPSRVQITKIEQRPVDVRNNAGTLKFDITVTNTGEGYIVKGMDECFKYKGRRPTEKVRLDVTGAYDISCEDNGEVTLQKDTKSKAVTCTANNIDPANLGKLASELTIVISGFAYEEEIAPVDVWLESSA